ncbi:MAG: EpsI family protein [Deltaproteobacteria bacterium]|nr:MAG: EpsI family protein [Deltaproteobacteria bacterium]
MPTRVFLISAIAIVFATSVYLHKILNRSEAAFPRDTVDTISRSVGGWEGKDEKLSNLTLQMLGLDEYIMRKYQKGQDVIWLYLGYYKNQRDGAVPHSPRHCYPGKGFLPIRTSIIEIPVRYGRNFTIRPNLYVFARGADREVVVYWYQSRGRVVSDEFREKLFLILDSIFRNRSDGALVRFSLATDAQNENKAINTLMSFISEIFPQIPRVVPD